MFPFFGLGKLLLTSIGFKPLKYFVDSTFRQKVRPVPGSVVYCDLWVAVEHSGIHVGEGEISNIEVEGFAESRVNKCDPESFTSKSMLGRKIYVSCDKKGAVGNRSVARYADNRVGESSVYGLVVKNCHQFSTQCVNVSGEDESSFMDTLRSIPILPSDSFEPTMAMLKSTARSKLGATKWRLWDWQNDEEEDREEEDPQEPDWKAHEDFFRNMPLNANSIERIRQELESAKEYETEISDEDIPPHIRQHLQGFRGNLEQISQKYEEVKGFLASCGADFSFADLQACGDDFSGMAQQLKDNTAIKELARKMGRNYIAEEKKKQTRIPQASKSEVHGTHRSDDIMRLLPSELVNLEDDTLEVLFYARLLEKNLLTYELSGTTWENGEATETTQQRTGPVVACLDTSGSMSGNPLIKAKALLLAISNILKEENRSLHVLLFGSAGEIREFSMEAKNKSADLLKFLQQGFGGGTDFETPLKHACGIIRKQEKYIKADILMISDGDCGLSTDFTQHLKTEKKHLDFSLYTVLCAGSRREDGISDEVVVL